MDLSFLLTSGSLLTLVYAGGKWVYGTYVAPRRAAPAAQSVKGKVRLKGFKRRSRVQNVQNAVNAGSTQQDAVEPTVNVQNVQAAGQLAAAESAPGAPAGEWFTLSPRELAQLAEALNLYRDGETVETAVSRAFNVTKGGSEGWKKAKSLFDAARAAPGAAPSGTYAPTAPVARRRRAAAR
jgi:hypothetical protein